MVGDILEGEVENKLEKLYNITFSPDNDEYGLWVF